MKSSSFVIGTIFTSQQGRTWENASFGSASVKISIWQTGFYSFDSQLIKENIILENLLGLGMLHRYKWCPLPIKTLIKSRQVRQRPAISICSIFKHLSTWKICEIHERIFIYTSVYQSL